MNKLHSNIDCIINVTFIVWTEEEHYFKNQRVPFFPWMSGCAFWGKVLGYVAISFATCVGWADEVAGMKAVNICGESLNTPTPHILISEQQGPEVLLKEEIMKRIKDLKSVLIVYWHPKYFCCLCIPLYAYRASPGAQTFLVAPRIA